MRSLRLFGKDRNGATSVEYAVLGSVIALVIVGAFANYAGIMGNMFGDLANRYEEASH